jgi:hypothetical protein
MLDEYLDEWFALQRTRLEPTTWHNYDTMSRPHRVHVTDEEIRRSMDDDQLDDPVLWREEHIDFAPLRTILPDHDDLSRWGWLEAMRSPDTGAIAHAYKLRFVGVLWVDHLGRIYRYEAGVGPRLLPGDPRIALLLTLLRLMEHTPEDLPRLVRLVPPDTPAEELERALDVKHADPECDGCQKEQRRSASTPPAGPSWPRPAF